MIPNCLAILIHGKWSHPNTPLLRILEKELKEKNYIVTKPNMPWSRTRLYDQTYEASLQDLGVMIQKYKQEGVKKVVLIGHSLGANAAMAYQAHVGDADAIVAITPGHVPSIMQERDPRHAYLLKKAQDKIKKNEVNTTIDFIDNNSGIRKKLTASIDIFLSYFDPSGLAHMPATVKKFRKSIPVLYIEGAHDHIHTGPDSVFLKIPQHRLNTYMLTRSNHMTTPEISSKQIISWLSFLSS
jgi:pimeloyl-ACP methyl ester carboxylesterase